MNKSKRAVFKLAILGIVAFSQVGYGQKQVKTYKEAFDVGDNTAININTSYADIEFDTWNKNQVVIEATIELVGATEEEAARYFEQNGIKIMGNSQEIDISTPGGSWSMARIAGLPGMTEEMVIEIPEIEPFFLDIEIPELPEMPELAVIPPMPPMPPMGFAEFDYEAYQERGEDYLKEWQERFEAEFDEEYAEKMEEWGKQMEANMEEYEKMRAEQENEREKMLEEREAMREERENVRREAEAARREAVEMRREIREEQRRIMEEQREAQRNIIISQRKSQAPRIFYDSSEGKSRKYEVKKTIRVKMPKSVKLNMNVRHGEVKLADNIRDIKANLAYSSLLAFTIDGVETDIIAAYSPVTVQNWKYGKLNTKYSDKVALQDVNILNLDATSSVVVIDRLKQEGNLSSNLGSVSIGSLAPEFKGLEVFVNNGELVCQLPEVAFDIRMKGAYSDISFPEKLALEKSGDEKNVLYEGYNLQKNSDKFIAIQSDYSKVKLQN